MYEPKILTMPGERDAWAVEPSASKNAPLAVIGELSRKLFEKETEGYGQVLPHILIYGRMLYMIDCVMRPDEILMGFRIFLFHTMRCVCDPAEMREHYRKWFGEDLAPQIVELWNSFLRARRLQSGNRVRYFLHRDASDKCLTTQQLIKAYASIGAKGVRIIPDREIRDIPEVLCQGTLLVTQPSDDGEMIVTTRSPSKYAYNPDNLADF